MLLQFSQFFPPCTSFAMFILPTVDPWVVRSVSLTCCSSPYICRERWDHLDHQWWPCYVCSLPQLPICAAPTSLVDCCFLNSLVVRLPFTSIFWHFWLIFVFQLFVSFLWLLQEVNHIYLWLYLYNNSCYSLYWCIKKRLKTPKTQQFIIRNILPLLHSTSMLVTMLDPHKRTLSWTHTSCFNILLITLPIHTLVY